MKVYLASPPFVGKVLTFPYFPAVVPVLKHLQADDEAAT